MEVLGYIRDKGTGEIKEYFNKDEDGYQIVTGPFEMPWVSNTTWEEVEKPLNFYPENDFEMTVSNLCDELKETLIRKNRDYGDSVRKTYGEFGDIAYIVRVTDKLERLKSLEKREAEVDESKNDTWLDLAGYSILRNATVRMQK